LGDVARHIAETEEGWFRYGIDHAYEKWPSYPAGDYPTVASIKTLLADVHARTDMYLENLSQADLDQQVKLAWDEDAPLSWVIWHVLDHELHHRGEIFLMLGLMGMEAPDI
jgi:uncharacterized damage-inducible protein DinB